MIKNSQSRIALRRKGALERRQHNLEVWTGKLNADSKHEGLAAKVACAQHDVDVLTKKTASRYAD